jgi:hypothetical protein
LISKRKIHHSISGRISILLSTSGILALVFSIYAGSQILAFIGLGLTFFSVLFALIRPVNFVEGSLLYNTAVSAYLTIDRIVSDFDYKGDAYYIPAYPKDAYIPEYLKGLKDSVVFISAETRFTMPAIEKIVKGKFLSKNPNGALVVPPGLGILNHIEKESQVDFSKIDLDEICEFLPHFILQHLNLAKEMGLRVEGDQVHLKLLDSLYKDLYSAQSTLKSVNLIGCPIVSAVACAFAKASARTVVIQKQQVSRDGLALEVWYRIVQEV